MAAIAKGPPTIERWHAKYLLAVSNSLLGDRHNAWRLADEAWQESINSRLQDLAPLHVMALRAGLAAADHDVAKERAMLTAANGLSVHATPELSSQMPTCGDRGVRPSDYVTFAYVTGPYLTHDLVPIVASRIEVVAPFRDALEGIALIQEAKESAAVGTVFTASCRTVVNPHYLGAPVLDDPLGIWFAAIGIYPGSATNEDDDSHLNAIADRIDKLAARFGTDSPLLIGPRWQTLTMLEKRAAAGDAVLPGQLTDLEKQIAAGMRRVGAPDWIATTIETRSRYREAAAQIAADPSQTVAIMALAKEQLLRAPFAVARTFFIEYMNKYKGDWPPSALQLMLELDANAPANLAGRDRQAWKLNVAQAEDVLGQKRKARATLLSAGLAPDLCVTADSEPSLLEQHFSYFDYPHDMIAGDQEGSV
ncbi:MAG: hypothetical protein JO335_05780, partial [Sphingomonas sp.]|nr:hypothetical protein [Sphingomonas sp.]